MKDIQKIKEFFSKPMEAITTAYEAKGEYFKPSIRKDKSNPNFLYVDIAYPAGSDVLSIGGSKTMGGQDREAGAAKALSMGNMIAKKLQSKYNIEDIDVKDLKNGKVEVFAVSDDFIKMASPSIDDETKSTIPTKMSYYPHGLKYQSALYKEAEEEETGVDMAKKQLDALGVKYEMSKTDKVRPFKVIYRPINKSDKFYDEFEDIVDLFNLKGFVKSSIKENNSIDHTKLISLIKSANNPRNLPIYYNSDNGVVNIGGVGYDKGELVKMFNSQPGQSLDIKNLFYKANQNPKETKNAIESMDPSIKVEIGYGYGNEPFVKYIKALMNEDFAKFDTLKMAINQHEKGEPYYDKTRLINIFNQLDNPDQERAKKEYSEYFGKSVNESNGFKSGKEFINIKLQKYPKAVAKINQLISIVGESNFTMEMAEWLFDFFNNASYESPVNEAKSEDKVDTITMDIPLFLRMLEYSREDAEQDLDLHDVTEKANKLGKERGILQMDDYEEIVGVDGEGNDLDENVAPNHTGKAAPFGSGYKPLEEKIAKALDQINEELCPAGKAYIKRRKAAGEKSSAYLSGRAVKVCKGQMSGKSKKK